MKQRAKVFWECFFIFSLIGITLQQDTTVTAAAADGSTKTAVSETPNSESSGGSKPVAPDNPGSSGGSKPASSSGSKCKPSEILTQDGCVDREFHLNRIIMRSWNDEGFDMKKARSGRVQTSKCILGQVMTPDGCRNMLNNPDYGEARAPVRHSHLVGSKVHHYSYIAHPDEEETQNSKPARHIKESGGARILGENRPRMYVFLPGRQLRHKKRCRSNEVRGMGNRCIHRRRAHLRRQPHESHTTHHHEAGVHTVQDAGEGH